MPPWSARSRSARRSSATPGIRCSSGPPSRPGCASTTDRARASPCATSMPTLSEARSKARLRGHGVPVAAERVVATADEAVAVAEALGYPVVPKLCGPSIAHKTERGLVRLGLRDASSVRAATTELLGAATPEDGDVGVLVGEMVRG